MKLVLQLNLYFCNLFRENVSTIYVVSHNSEFKICILDTVTTNNTYYSLYEFIVKKKDKTLFTQIIYMV